METEVQYTQGFTLNMGNYQSARVDVGITYTHVPPEQQELMFAKAKNRVQEILAEEATRLRNKT